MATDYPIEITDPDGSVRIAGLADFTDPDNQPAGTNQPFQPAHSGSVTVIENSVVSGSDPVLTYDDDANLVDVAAKMNVDNHFNAAANVSLVTDGTDVLSFFGAAGSTQPQVPATPLPQDIVDALVALGLVSQAS